jgi:hypothetical protein
VKRSIFIQTLLAGIFAALAGNIYNRIYFFATQVDYSAIVNPISITAINMVVSLFAGLIYFILRSMFQKSGPIIFNFLYSTGSFVCVIIPIAITLPLSTPFPELFPGLAVPMVLFPVISWMTIDPLFKKS